MSSVSKSLVISFAERYVLIALRLTSFFVLARLLTPEEIGLYSVAMAVIGIAHILRDFGIGSYLVQEKELTELRIRTAFTITLCIATALGGLIIATAGPVADFYDDERLAPVLRLLSINFLLIPFNSTTMAILRRNMRFDVLLWFNLSAAAVGTLSAIVLAAAGFGFYSLVYSSLSSTATMLAAGAVYRRKEFWLKPSLAEARRVLGFGSQVAIVNILGQVAINLNGLVVGRALGFTAVGLLSRAQGVMNLFHRDIMASIRNVAYPAFAEAHRKGSNLDAIHSRSVTAVTAIAWPFYGFLSLYPQETLRLMFGPQWDSAVPLVPVLCLAGAVAALWSLTSNALTAVGRVDLATRAALIVQPVRIGLLVSCAMIADTLMPFAYTLLATYVFQVANGYWHKQQALPTDWDPLLRGVLASLTVTVVALTPAGIVRLLVDCSPPVVPEYVLVPACALLTLACWVVALRVLNHPTLRDPAIPYRIRKLLSISGDRHNA